MSFWYKWLWLGFVLGLAGCGTAVAIPIPTPTFSPQLKMGQTAFMQNCGSCHSVADQSIIVGPSLAGVATRAGGRVPNQDAAAYLLNSILRPSDYVVDGFQDGLMPNSFGKKLTGEELDAVVAYLLTMQEP